MTHSIHEQVAQAQKGNREALEAVITYAQGYIYNLALRMLQVPADAEDATQEILIRLVTHLGQFRAESAFTTWMYSLATHHLLNRLSRDRERHHHSFDELTERLEMSLSLYTSNAEDALEQAELVEEVRRNCTLAMTMCLSMEDRLALVLGEVLEMPGEEAAAIMEISPAAYRKRLSRARQALVSFVSGQCGIVNPANPCRCHKHVQNKIQAGLLDPARLRYSQPHDPASAAEAVRSQQEDLDSTCRTIALIRSHPSYQSRTGYEDMIQRIFAAGDLDR